MTYGFKPTRRFGVHFDLAHCAVQLLETVNFLKKGKIEKEFERDMVASLETSPDLKGKLITQVGENQVTKIHQSPLFGFKHRPDSAIRDNGTAIEVKVVTRGHDVRDLIGQAFAYRMQYRFVVLVLIDKTPGLQVVKLCKQPESNEAKLFRDLAEELNIFTIVGPLDSDKNIVFMANDSEQSKYAA